MLQPTHTEATALRDAADNLSARIEDRRQELLSDPDEFADRIPDLDLREFISRVVACLYCQKQPGESASDWINRSYHDATQVVDTWATAFADTDVE